MMNSGRDDVLTQAYQLIEADRLDEAKALLTPVLETDKDNPDAWWLYAHAVTDTGTARLALNNVLRLDGDYPEAADLLKSLNEKSAPEVDFGSQGEPAFLPSVPATLPGLPTITPLSDNEIPREFDDESHNLPIYQRPVFLAAIIGIVLLIAIIIVILKPFGGQTPSEATPTTVAAQDTSLVPTLASGGQSVPPTQQLSPTAGGPFDDVKAALSAFNLAESGVGITTTNLGNTLLANVCTTAGREMRTLLPQVIDALAKASANYAEQIAAIGVHMLDCGTSADLLTIGASADDAVAYANGTMSDKDFEAHWQPIQ